MVRSRVSRAFHFLTDRHRETPRMRVRPKFGWQEMLEMMEAFQIDAPYPYQRQWVIDALYPHPKFGEIEVLYDPFMPRKQMFLINPAQIIVVPPEPAPWTQCIVPW